MSRVLSLRIEIGEWSLALDYCSINNHLCTLTSICILPVFHAVASIQRSRILKKILYNMSLYFKFQDKVSCILHLKLMLM